MKRAALAIVGLAALLALAALTPLSASAAPARHCGSAANGRGPQNDRSLPISEITARNMTCASARGAIKAGSFATHGACFGGAGSGPCRTSFRTPGFRCTAPTLGEFHCTAGDRAFHFYWSE